MLLHGRLADGWLVQTPFGPKKPIWGHMGAYWPVWARIGPARAHAPHETMSEINTFFEKQKHGKSPALNPHALNQHLTG